MTIPFHKNKMAKSANNHFRALRIDRIKNKSHLDKLLSLDISRAEFCGLLAHNCSCPSKLQWELYQNKADWKISSFTVKGGILAWRCGQI
jgi:hypothetical protein